MIDELAELIWAAVNDVSGQSSWTWDDLDSEVKGEFRADVIEAARRHRGDDVAEAIIAEADKMGRATG